eukprot:CAMPEP_0202979024 /NCGR_PEP_ID=MMETSP1396-20130829/85293_1 /ASSEMBLY_ACC=CAM_ASM_000872 /TAXON_ID= /ORGANISM="Pseudokeronopsis sp., Strain Brazil" /LENGTH=62 /DNA_ID=CAMNT_0049718275 /DNA_START=221 /DNA_END=409 /DNA_ORIENTATION=+
MAKREEGAKEGLGMVEELGLLMSFDLEVGSNRDVVEVVVDTKDAWTRIMSKSCETCNRNGFD